MEFCCPLCDRPFAPEQMSRRPLTAECTSCQMSVLLLGRALTTDDSADTQRLAWPRGFAIADLALRDSTSVQLGDGIYRTHEVAPRPGLAITREIPRDRHEHLVRAIVAGELLVATIIALAAGASRAVPVCLAGALIVLVWSLASARHRRQTIRVDQQGLHWPGITWTTQLRHRSLANDDIAQLYVRNTSLIARSWLPRFTLYARDRAGHDHAVTKLDTPEQAWWLEDRLEGHLGLVGRAVAGEYRRQALPAER